MAESASVDVTGLLHAWRGGDRLALDKLVPLVHEELRRLARRSTRNQASENTLQATALVNEAYLRLVGVNNVDWRDRTHFFAVSAQIMRWILVDRARARSRRRTATPAEAHSSPVNLDELPDVASNRGAELIALDDALNTLSQIDPRQARVVELRFFGGLSVEETAEILTISPQSVMRDWKLARAWLLRELSRA